MKTYSTRSNAKRAAIKAGHDIDTVIIVMEDKGKWAFYPPVEKPMTPKVAPEVVEPKKSDARKRTEREYSNGVYKPNAGKCRIIWDWCEEISERAGTPTVAEVRAEAEYRGWNTTNAVIEYYNWRKFSGISGRAKKS